VVQTDAAGPAGAAPDLLSSFNVATFKSRAEEDDVAFWDRLIPESQRPKAQPAVQVRFSVDALFRWCWDCGAFFSFSRMGRGTWCVYVRAQPYLALCAQLCVCVGASRCWRSGPPRPLRRHSRSSSLFST
jgi:hypothetical protein